MKIDKSRLERMVKDFLKNIAHRLPFIPYRKPSKRYKVWNRLRERQFLQLLETRYANNSTEIDAISVSVVMPVYNRAHCITTAIKSVLQQSHHNFELLIVDDGSSDGLEHTLRRSFSDCRIKLIKKDHKGVSSARNAGIAAASGDYLFYLDSDNSWYENYLTRMLTFMVTGGLETAYAGARIVDNKNTVTGYFGERFIWKECWELNHIDINTFAHRKELLNNGFRFDESLKRLVDWDFILSVTAYHRTAYAPFVGVEYDDGIRSDRITYAEHPGDEIKKVVKYIQQKHMNAFYDPATSDPKIRPQWKQIVKE